jgi:predicted ATPase
VREASRSRSAFPNTLGPVVDPEPPPENNLPAQLTPLIGREREIATVKEILQREEVRLLTLTGPGGVGKTRLGLRVAADLIEDFEDGVRFVSLAVIRDPELVVVTIARALELEEAGERSPLERLKAHLREKRLLLLLDNFEHVVETAPAVAELLRACSRLKALVTSREVLHLSGEHEFPVPPLELPDTEHPSDIEALSRKASVALFIQRAQAVEPDFRMTGENAPAVSGICRRLDGLPLAIELAAARTRLLTPQALLTRLHHRLRVLTGGARDAPARQQTLKRTIEWSYALLAADEQQLFRRLAVFVGGCTLEAVVNAAGEPETEVLEGLEALVEKSLLRRVEQVNGEPRLSMLETIREYALERLAMCGEEEDVCSRHARYYLALAAAPKLTTGEQVARLDRLETEHGNLRAALGWFLDRGETEAALRLGAVAQAERSGA